MFWPPRIIIFFKIKSVTVILALKKNITEVQGNVKTLMLKMVLTRVWRTYSKFTLIQCNLKFVFLITSGN